MPVNRILRKVDIKLDGETTPIIDAYKSALNKMGFKFEEADQGEKTLASPTQKRKRDSMLCNVTETVLGIPFGKHKYCFDEQTLELEVPAGLLLDSYNQFLIQMLTAQNVSAAVAEQTEINSKYVLVQELLSRLMTIALDKRYGLKYIEVLRIFVDNIRQHESLIEKPLFGSPANSKFLKTLSTTHVLWINDIERMINSTALIHKNTLAIAKTLDSLEKIKYTLQTQLIAYLNPNRTDGFTKHYAQGTLKNEEERILQQVKCSGSIQDNIVDNNKSPQQKLIVSCLPALSQKYRDKITELYDLLNRNQVLFDVLSQLDMLMKDTGWLSVLFGFIDFEKIAKLFNDYGQQCKSVLKTDKALEEILNTPAGVALVKCNTVTGEHLTYDVMKGVEGLSELHHSDLKEYMRNMISGRIASLVTLQSKLGEDYRFINTQVITGPQSLLYQLMHADNVNNNNVDNSNYIDNDNDNDDDNGIDHVQLVLGSSSNVYINTNNTNNSTVNEDVNKGNPVENPKKKQKLEIVI